MLKVYIMILLSLKFGVVGLAQCEMVEHCAEILVPLSNYLLTTVQVIVIFP